MDGKNKSQNFSWIDRANTIERQVKNVYRKNWVLVPIEGIVK
jgi:hypothetical protein